MNKIYTLLLIGMMMSSCTEEPIIIPDFEPIDSERVVLLEDLTGVRCSNCPSASLVIESLLERYDGQLVAVGIHGSFLAGPYSDSRYDFRNQFAKDLENYFAPWEGKPSAAINRKMFEGQDFLAIPDESLWASFIEQELNEAPRVELNVSSSLDTSSASLSIQLGILPLENMDGDLRVSVMLTESHLIDKQADKTGIIEEFEHNHVLRTMLTAFDGDTIDENFIKNELLTRQWEYSFDTADAWILENMEVIIFVSRNKEVLQAIKLKLNP